MAAATLAGLLQTEDYTLVAEWLTVAASTAHHAPHRHLPALLDLAHVHPDRLRTPVAGALGERGRWLAELRAEWGDVLAEARREDDVPDPWGSRQMWSHGDLADRTAWFRAARAGEPALAREELSSGWGSEGPAERAAFVAELRVGLGPDDEEFLELVLDDSRAEVRHAAAELLRALPRSAYSHRMLTRATSWIRLERRLLRTELVVVPPDERDASLKRDQVPDPPKGSGGRRAWFLTQVLARVPLSGFAAAFDTEASRLVGLAATSDWAAPMIEGLATAARVSGNVDWCRALVEHDPSAHLLLAGRLPSAEQARAIRAAAASTHPGALVRLATDLPRPVSTDVAVAMIEATADVERFPATTQQMVLDAVAHAAPADEPAPVVEALCARIAAFEPGSAQWSAASAALNVINTRHRLREELT